MACSIPSPGPSKLSKPLIAVVHGDTWNMGHELHLVADIRVASADVRFGQDENTHGRFPGGGSTIRFPREAGWGNAMRYMLTGDHWGAEEAYRMGVIQEIAPDPAKALEAGIGLAQKIAACGPLGIKTTLESAHLSIDESEAAAFAKLDEQFGGLFHTEDFIEGRKAEAEGRAPVYQGMAGRRPMTTTAGLVPAALVSGMLRSDRNVLHARRERRTIGARRGERHAPRGA